MTRGYFITVEGPDGSGKSTLLKGISARLTQAGTPHITTREPGGSSIGAEVRQLLLHHKAALEPKAELWLFMADRYQHVIEKIRPALESGTWVLCDRFNDSSYAYQGGEPRFFSDSHLLQMLHEASDGLIPDKTLLIDLDPSVALARSIDKNRMEERGLALQEKVHRRYLDLARQEPHRFIILDGTLSREKLLEAALLHLPR